MIDIDELEFFAWRQIMMQMILATISELRNTVAVHNGNACNSERSVAAFRSEVFVNYFSECKE